MVTAADISEQKLALEKLEEGNKHYFELAENAPVGILLCDPGGTIIYANKNVAETLGSPSVEETMRINLLSFPPLIKFGFSKKLEQCLRKNKTTVFELNYVSKWGKRIWLRIHIKSWIDSGVITGAQVIIDDISEKKQLEEELRRLSETDVLTGAYNRRYFIQKLDKEVERTKRYKGNFSVIMLDLDHFKRINDRHGHNTGDMILKQVTVAVESRIRKIDVLARWGGEEFVVMLPRTTAVQAKSLAEDLLLRISSLPPPGTCRITASFGVTQYAPGDTVDTIVQRADNLMYAAKARGRNQVVLS
jgi:diguanylate cyclase (GGDEF)-like protein/PAS domain S-box-containing protein